MVLSPKRRWRFHLLFEPLTDSSCKVSPTPKLYSTLFNEGVQLLWANATLNESFALHVLFVICLKKVFEYLLRQNKSEFKGKT